MRHGISTLISWKARKSEISKLILKMMMLNILLLSIFQSVFVVTLPENEKLTCGEQEGRYTNTKNFSFLQINEEIQPNIEGHLS